MRKKARGGSWQGRAGSEGSSWVDAGRPPLSRQERDPGGAGPGRSRNGGRKAGGTEGEGIAEPWARDFFGPFRPTKESGKTPATVFIVPRPGERIARCGKCDAAGRGTGDRGLCPVCGSESGRSRSLLRLVGPLPAQDLFRAGRPPVATTIDRPSLRSCPRLFVWSPHHHGGRPRSSHSLPEEKRGSWSSGDGPGRGQKRPEEEEGTPVFLFPRPFSLLSLMPSSRQSCFLPAVSAVILSKNPVQ